MAEFATAKSSELEFGTASFVQVARQVATGESGARTHFASILRGYVSAQGQRSIKSSTTFPMDPEVLRWTSEQLAGIAIAAEATRVPCPRSSARTSWRRRRRRARPGPCSGRVP